jgi:hypothetical protein
MSFTPGSRLVSQLATSLSFSQTRSIGAAMVISRRPWIAARSSIRLFFAYSSCSTAIDGPV